MSLALIMISPKLSRANNIVIFIDMKRHCVFFLGGFAGQTALSSEHLKKIKPAKSLKAIKLAYFGGIYTHFFTHLT